MTSILLIDDETDSQKNLSTNFVSQGYDYIYTVYLEEATDILKQEAIDLILLNIDSQVNYGIEICHIRRITKVPILLLSSNLNKKEILNAYNAGADDLISKPYDNDILMAKINAMIRRINKIPILNFKGLEIDDKLFEINYFGEKIPTTKKEYSLIENFLQNPNQVFSREELMMQFWKYKPTDNRTIDSHMRNIREKLRSVHFPVEKHLITVWGFGYKWVE